MISDASEVVTEEYDATFLVVLIVVLIILIFLVWIAAIVIIIRKRVPPDLVKPEIPGPTDEIDRLLMDLPDPNMEGILPPMVQDQLAPVPLESEQGPPVTDDIMAQQETPAPEIIRETAPPDDGEMVATHQEEVLS